MLLTLAISTTCLAENPVRIRMQDGSIWRGEISQRIEVTYRYQFAKMTMQGILKKVERSYITVRGKYAGQMTDKIIMRSKLLAIKLLDEQSEHAPKPALPDQPKYDISPSETKSNSNGKSSDKTESSSVPKLLVLPLKGTVGTAIRHEEVEKIGIKADEYGPGQIIVLTFDSSGGSIEMREIHSTILRIKKRHRVVAWIKSAISAAAASAIACDEIYFMTEGTLGAMTGFAGGVAFQGEQLQEWLKFAEEWMSNGGRYPYIADAMIHAPSLLSYDKDEDTGEVTWHKDLSGEFILSRENQNLVFNASQALHSKFSQGTADTEEELAKLLDLPVWKEATDYGRKISKDWQKTVKQAEKEIPKLRARLGFEGTSGGAASAIGAQIKNLKKLKQWWRRCPNVMASMGLLSVEDIDDRIEELRRQLNRNR